MGVPYGYTRMGHPIYAYGPTYAYGAEHNQWVHSLRLLMMYSIDGFISLISAKTYKSRHQNNECLLRAYTPSLIHMDHENNQYAFIKISCNF